MKFFIIPADKVDDFDETPDPQFRIAPTPIYNGTHAGKFAVNVDIVKSDRAFKNLIHDKTNKPKKEWKTLPIVDLPLSDLKSPRS